MIRKEDIYASTNGGLTILQYYYPTIQQEYAYNRHKFKLRNEDDASCVLRERKTNDGVTVFCITDFGNDGREKTPIDIAMEFEGKNFYETCCLLAERYNISEYKQSFIKPGREERQATDNEPDGTFFFKEKEPSQKELELMGSLVTKEVFFRYGWKSLASYTVVKDRKAVTKSSTDSFPIFARECKYIDNNGEKKSFYKVYQPLNEKQFRFIYYPIGGRPSGYINGLYELIKAYDELNTEDEEESYEDGNKVNKGTAKRKLLKAFICSGERDALTLAARGCFPLWFNSETAQVSYEDMKNIRNYVKFVYNIPDIDDTGIRQGKKLALEHLDVYTVWLPSDLKKFKDWRGKPRKDFRDWCDLHPSLYEFEKLCSQAMPATFWRISTSKSGNVNLDLNSEIFQYFMELNDFFLYKEKDRDDVYTLMKRSGHIINKMNVRDIKEWMKNWAREKCLSLDIRNLIAGTKINESEVRQINMKDVEVITTGRDWQIYYFSNSVWKVTSKGIDDVTKDGLYSAFADTIIDHKVHITPKPFEAKKIEDGKWTIDIKDKSSKYFCYLINSSRIYWKKELEGEILTWDEDKRDEYLSRQKFSITSELLSFEENQEQVLNLLSKIFCIGYYLHRYKDPAKAWAAYGMDWKMGENGQNNGRSGKSFFYMFSKYMQKRICLSGRNKKLLDNNHVFENINRYTDIVIIDDCDVSIKPESFYTAITGDITVNPKQQKSFELHFDNSPKFAFTTNYVPSSFAGSDVGRLLYLVFSDYYHEYTDEYKQKRQISDDFGKSLYSNYDNAEWNADFNFWCWCLSFYLEHCDEGKISPVLDNIMKRTLKAKLDASFEDWAEGYFSLDGNNNDRLIPKNEVMLNCRMETGKQLTSQAFMKKLDAWIQLSPHHKELNPQELWGKNSKRIIKTVSGLTTEYLYVRTYNSKINQ